MPGSPRGYRAATALVSGSMVGLHGGNRRDFRSGVPTAASRIHSDFPSHAQRRQSHGKRAKASPRENCQCPDRSHETQHSVGGPSHSLHVPLPSRLPLSSLRIAEPGTQITRPERKLNRRPFQAAGSRFLSQRPRPRSLRAPGPFRGLPIQRREDRCTRCHSRPE